MAERVPPNLPIGGNSCYHRYNSPTANNPGLVRSLRSPRSALLPLMQPRTAKVESQEPTLTLDAPTMEAPSPPARVQRRLMATLFSAQSVYNAAQIVSFTPLPLAAVFLTGSEAAAGLPSTITLVGRALIAYPIGWLMGKLGRRLGISLGFSLSVLGTLLCAFALLRGSFAFFLLGALINGFGRGTGEQSRYAAADIVPLERGARAIGTIVFAGTVGAILGPLLLTPAERAAEQRGLVALAGPYFMTAALSFIAFAIIFLFLRPDPMRLAAGAQPMRAPESAGNDASPTGRSLRVVFAGRTVQLAVFALTISQLVMTMLMVITPLHMDHEKLPTQAVSWVIMAHTLGMFGLSGVTGRLTARYGPQPVIAAGGVVLAIAAILAPLAATVPMLALALFLLGVGWNLGYVAGSALLADAVAPAERGRTQGVSETLVAVAAAAGSFSTGPTFQRAGYVAVSMIGLALALALLAAQAAVQRRAVLPAAAD